MKRFIWLSLGLYFISTPLKAGFPAVDYMKNIRAALEDCTVQYKMECIYPDGKHLSVNGLLGIQGNKYYDSSNARFVLFNEKWQITADHLNKILSVGNVEQLNKKLNGVASVSMSRYMFGGDFVLENMRLSKTKEAGDTVWLNVDVGQQQVIRRFNVVMSKQSMRLLAYDISMECPLKSFGYDDADDGTVMKVQLSAEQIAYPAPSWMFDSRRIVKEHGKKASLKRFGDYKTYLSNPKKSEK